MFEGLLTFLSDNWFNFILAIAIFIVGKWIARKVKNITKMLMLKRKVDETLAGFVSAILYALLMVVIVMSALGKLGINTTSFVAVLGALSLAIGLAFQGTLSNFASGILIIMLRPFKIGDYVEVAGIMGTVEEVHIFDTIIRTPDNKQIIVPNGSIMGEVIINYSAKATRRVDLTFGVSYEDDLSKVKKVIEGIVEADDRVLKGQDTLIAVSELADSSVNLVCRPWVKSADYWPVYFDLTEKVKVAFDKEGITIPYPRREIIKLGEGE